MIIRFSISVIVGCLLLACSGKSNTSAPPVVAQPIEQKIEIDPITQIIDTIFLDNTDTAILVKDKPIQDDMGDKRKSYSIDIYFPHKNWPKLRYDQAIGAELIHVGDLDDDQQPELLLRPDWFRSCWASINLFSLKGNHWEKITAGNMYFCNDKYPLAKRIIKTDKGYALLTDSMTDNRFITLKKDIKF